MRPSVRLGRVAGISVGLHWSIALIAGLLTVSLSGTYLPEFAPGYGNAAYLVTALVTGAAFLASIVAHELGHSLVAVRNGIRVKGVTLFALGGVASLDGEPSNPGAAARIALAGPGVSGAVGAASLGSALLANALSLPALVVAALLWLGVINLSLALFNLLPALPLDGGRVLQSWLWHRRGDRHSATISAAGVGRLIGWGLVLFGLWELSRGATNGLWTAFIGWFVITSARGEAWRARIERQREQAPVTGPLGVPFPFTATFAAWPPPRLQDRFPGQPRHPGHSGHPGGGPAGPVIDVDSHPVDSHPVDSCR